MSATLPNESSSYVYQGVVYEKVTPSNSPQPRPHVGILTCLSQGVVTGAVMIFLLCCYSILSQPQNGFNFYYPVFFPIFLCWGIVPGLLEGVVLGACTKVAGHNLRTFTRAIVGATVLLTPYAVLIFLFLASEGPHERASDYLIPTTVVAAIGAMFGLFTGSHLDFWRELTRGVEWVPGKSQLLTGFTGLFLRLAIIFFLMESTLGVLVLQPASSRDFVLVSIALVHFIAASVIVFARLRFWLLLQLALVINFPLVAYVLEVAKDDEFVIWYAGVSYLIAWAAFLIVRSQYTYRALDSLKEEIRYYLID